MNLKNIFLFFIILISNNIAFCSEQPSTYIKPENRVWPELSVKLKKLAQDNEKEEKKCAIWDIQNQIIKEIHEIKKLEKLNNLIKWLQEREQQLTLNTFERLCLRSAILRRNYLYIQERKRI